MFCKWSIVLLTESERLSGLFKVWSNHMVAGPCWGAYSAPSGPLADEEGLTAPSPRIPLHSALQASNLGLLDFAACVPNPCTKIRLWEELSLSKTVQTIWLAFEHTIYHIYMI